MKINKNLPIKSQSALRKLEGFQLKPQYRRPNRPTHISKILIVDDYKEFLRLFERYLHGTELVLDLIDPNTEGPEKVYKFVKEKEYQMVIMDGKMGPIRGHDLVWELRFKGFRGYIVAFSADADMQTEMMNAGADLKIGNKLNGPGEFKAFFEFH